MLHIFVEMALNRAEWKKTILVLWPTIRNWDQGFVVVVVVRSFHMKRIHLRLVAPQKTVIGHSCAH